MLATQSCSRVLPVDDREFAAFMEMSADEFMQRMFAIFQFQDPLMRHLLTRYNHPDEQYVLVHYLTLGWDMTAHLLLGNINKIRSFSTDDYLRALPKHLLNLSDLSTLSVGKYNTTLTLKIDDPQDQKAIRTFKALYQAFSRRNDVQKAFRAYLDERNTELLFKRLVIFLKAHQEVVNLRTQMRPDGSFFPVPPPPLGNVWLKEFAKGALIISSTGFASAAALYGLTHIHGMLIPGTTASAAIYGYFMWRRRHANYFQNQKAHATLTKLTQRKPALWRRALQVLDEASTPRGAHNPTLQLKARAQGPAPFNPDWLVVSSGLDLSLDENRHEFFAGLLQAINWFQGERLALQSDQTLRNALGEIRSLIESTHRAKESKQRQSLYQFSQLYVELARMLSQRIDGLVNLQKRLVEISSALDAHLEYVKSLQDDALVPYPNESLRDLYNQSHFWSEWGERLLYMQDLLQFEKETLAATRDGLRNLLPAIVNLQSGDARDSEITAKHLLEQIGIIVSANHSKSVL